MKNKNYSVIFRIIHWSIAICMTLILITIFLRLTWMNKYNVANIINDYLATTDQSLSQDQLIVLAKQIRKPMWDWHIYLGYLLVGLFSIRFFIPLFGEMKFQSPFKKQLILKEKIQHWIYLIFYFCIIISLITGLIIKFGSKDLKKPMEEIHELSIYYLLAYIFIHLIGIFIAEFTNQKGLVSKVISGKRKESKQ